MHYNYLTKDQKTANCLSFDFYYHISSNELKEKQNKMQNIEVVYSHFMLQKVSFP